MPSSDQPPPSDFHASPGPTPVPAASGPASRPRGARRVRGNEPWPPPEYTAIGRILRPHGIRGELRVYPYTRTADDLVGHCPDEVLIWSPKSGAAPFHVESLSAHQNIVLVALEEIETRNDAERLRDTFLCIPEDQRWDLQEDEYYMDDLAGLELRDADSGATLGHIIRVAEGAAHDHLEVQVPSLAKPALIPFVHAFVVKVDIQAGHIQVRLPEGLLDLDNKSDE